MGEPAFREMEAAIARELSARQGVVISTGGRLMLDPENAAALSRTGRVFCLVATPKEILERVQKDTDTNVRPLLSVSNPIERIVELMQERQTGYRRFPQMMTSDKTPEEIAQNIIDIYQMQQF
jgi:shikimate kinase